MTRAELEQKIAPYAGGVAVDIGTGDGRFVRSMARQHADRFFIGIDPNRKPLEKPSMKATRKAAKGGLPNAILVQAAVEDLPDEFFGIAREIYINFPWGSLLRSAATGDVTFLDVLRRVAADECLLMITIGIDPSRDRGELERLGLSDGLRTPAIIARYAASGFQLHEHHELTRGEWQSVPTTWAKRLQGSATRVGHFFIFRIR